MENSENSWHLDCNSQYVPALQQRPAEGGLVLGACDLLVVVVIEGWVEEVGGGLGGGDAVAARRPQLACAQSMRMP